MRTDKQGSPPLGKRALLSPCKETECVMLERPNKQLAAALLRMRESLHDDPDLTEEWDMGPPSDPPDLAGKSEAETVELIVEWFYRNFEDVAHYPMGGR